MATRFIGGAYRYQEGEAFADTVSGTTLASTTLTATTFSNASYALYEIAGYSDKAANTLQVLESGTVIFHMVQAASGAFQYSFGVPLIAGKGKAMSVTLDGTDSSVLNVTGRRMVF